MLGRTNLYEEKQWQEIVVACGTPGDAKEGRGKQLERLCGQPAWHGRCSSPPLAPSHQLTHFQGCWLGLCCQVGLQDIHSPGQKCLPTELRLLSQEPGAPDCRTQHSITHWPEASCGRAVKELFGKAVQDAKNSQGLVCSMACFNHHDADCWRLTQVVVHMKRFEASSACPGGWVEGGGEGGSGG